LRAKAAISESSAGRICGKHLDHGHLGAKRAVERREFDADGARADDEQRFGNAVRNHGLEIGPDQFLVRLQAGKNARPRAGGDDDVLGRIGTGAQRALRRFAAAGLHRDLARRFDRRLAPDHGDLVLFHQEADAVVEPFGDGPRALDHRRRIVADLAGREPIILGVLQVMENLRRTQQRLGRDAAPIEANAAQIFALDDGRRKAKLRGADGGDVSAGAGTDDDDVEICISHVRYTSIITGFSISALNAPMSCAPSAPSTER
jgi:hypothetical protein